MKQKEIELEYRQNKKMITDFLCSNPAYYKHQLFNDWITCMALSISNASAPIHDQIWQDREKEFAGIMKKYPEDMREKIEKASAALIVCYSYKFSDVLGEIYMDAGLGNKHAGQFFTPFTASELMSGILLQDDIDKVKNDEEINLNEPACGSGGMIIATAKRISEKGIDYTKTMNVVAQDIDWTAVYMTYIACSLYGIKAVVVQGDTLKEPYTDDYPEKRKFYTPMYILRNAGFDREIDAMFSCELLS